MRRLSVSASVPGKWLATIALSVTLWSTPSMTASPGDLDPTFGQGGKLTVALAGGPLIANAIAVQTDGRIIVAGAPDVFGSGFALVRLLTDGNRDAGFGTGGEVITAFNGRGSVSDLLIQPDGRIVAVGRGDSGHLAIARYLQDGGLDPTFSEDGKNTLFVGGSYEEFSVALQADGKLVVAGGDYFIVRFHSDGRLDTDFDGDGYLQVTFPGFDDALANAVVVDQDQTIVVAGAAISWSAGGTDLALSRHAADGSPSGTFGSAGLVTTDLGSPSDSIEALLLQSDGGLVAIGVPGAGSFTLVRYLADGSVDSAFGDGGRVDTDFGGDDRPRAGALQQDGKIVAVGFAHVDYDSKFAIARYREDGELDTHFGDCGKVLTDFGDPADIGVLCPPTRSDCSEDIARDVAIQADGRILVVGGTGAGTPSPTSSIARYIGTGVAGPDFDGDGHPDRCDLDDDNDGVPDQADAFPFDPTETVDNDLDGIGDTTDPDDDNDGAPDGDDAFPLNPLESNDSDGDGVGDNSDTVVGNNASTYFPLSYGSVWHYQSDNGANTVTVLPGTTLINGAATTAVQHSLTGSTGFVTSDSDGIKRHRVVDSDYSETYLPPIRMSRSSFTPGEVITGSSQVQITVTGLGTFPLSLNYRWDHGAPEPVTVPAGTFVTYPIRGRIRVSGFILGTYVDETVEEAHWAAKGIGLGKTSTTAAGMVETDELQWTSLDSDGDTIANLFDNCGDTANLDQVDTDADGWGDACDHDDDGDRVTDANDNCALLPNTDQLDHDGDGSGDACDNDDDNDGVPDAEDRFPLDETEWADNDNDGLGDNADKDDDNDGMSDDFELAYGLSPTDPSDAALDSDGDGDSNLAEYLNGTDPRDPDSNQKTQRAGALMGIITILLE